MSRGGFVRFSDGVFERSTRGKCRTEGADEGITRSMCADDLHRYGGSGDSAVFDSSGHTGAARRNHDVAVTPPELDAGPQGIFDRVHNDAGEHLRFDAIDDQDVDKIDQLRSERARGRRVQADENTRPARLSGGRHVGFLAGFVLQQQNTGIAPDFVISREESGICRLEPETITAP